MSFKDYNMHYVVINGVTNEQIKVPNPPTKSIVLKDYSLDKIMLFDVILGELKDADSVTIFKSYMKD